VTSAIRFHVGQLVRHLRFGYRGVVFDVDEVFRGSDAWYEQEARSRPPRDRPWYHVIVHDASHTTYVADRHLEADASGEAVESPVVAVWFDRFEDGRYVRREVQ
jgi:heat shock protein HspQ